MRPRRLERRLRFVDRYLVLAVVGVVAYIVVINLLSGAIAVNIRNRVKAVSTPEAKRAAAGVRREAFWPYRWPVAPIAELHMIKEAMMYVTTSLTNVMPFLTHLPEVQLAAWDLVLLTGVGTDMIRSANDLKKETEEALGTATAFVQTEALAAVREALNSAAVVWSIKGKSAEADEVRKMMEEMPTRLAPVGTLNASSWRAFSSDVWRRVTTSWNSSTPGGITAVHDALRTASRSYWRLDERISAVPPLHHSYLLPLRAGTYDAVVPFTSLLLHLWVLSGQREADKQLVETYDAAVESIVQGLFYTRTVDDGAHAMNFTFVGSRAEALVPVATPRMCALAGVLAQGIRYGAHRYPARSPSARYSEDDVLQAAEALAASCMQLYADPAGHKLRSAVYVTDSGHVPGYTRTMKPEKGASLRSSYCDIPAVLLESFYELYQTTHDSMYGLWSTLVMRQDTSDHCGLRQTDLTSATPWLRHIRELRSLWLLFHRMECLVHRHSRGSQRICELAKTTMVSPFTGHLVPVPSVRATS
ncbi:hypothetical protein JKF63_06907 [Porcisia hertigi]|uniref:Uncharacterized protein n=1 Tax=Porcisia hertigi TaxID=2761500 RepID=A0A836LJB7_9TRYP|nr:hypothetical protein JKF63_06907 [Porcisia hertigi]